MLHPAILFRNYLAQTPESQIGFRRSWIPSRNLSPGRWVYVPYTPEDAGFDIRDDVRWLSMYDEWYDKYDEDIDIPTVEIYMNEEINHRDSDYINFRFRVITALAARDREPRNPRPFPRRFADRPSPPKRVRFHGICDEDIPDSFV
jgi:hypothetical protein